MALRRHAFRDAPRHKSVPHRAIKVGRRASRTACRRRASHDSHVTTSDVESPEMNTGAVLTLVPTLRVDMHFVTLRVTGLRSTAQSRSDAERPERHVDAERRTIVTQQRQTWRARR
ncbi:DUF1534 domain-containing protein [Pseudomonas syringae pv. maculicola str. ES4326]|uniref:DUF1534 domain-containing protein n=1 Tax=Pseudomonas syringae pv. maculicola str. ES4326 TaxID=629265 RepID=A0A8T8C008_PSEYM|nr:DUF1534 domain-containing protein [Pseudomonas syringae pv. maculicola str. ES4326]